MSAIVRGATKVAKKVAKRGRPKGSKKGRKPIPQEIKDKAKKAGFTSVKKWKEAGKTFLQKHSSVKQKNSAEKLSKTKLPTSLKSVSENGWPDSFCRFLIVCTNLLILSEYFLIK